MLAYLVESHTDVSDLAEDPSQPLNYTALAMDTEGYLITDTKDLVSRAIHQAAIRVAKLEDEDGFKVQFFDMVLGQVSHSFLAIPITRRFHQCAEGLRPPIAPGCALA